jgi:1-acyl-sn-glycerol-3-phosphate acyltransferase
MTARELSRPYPVQFAGSALARRVLHWLGWRVRFEGLPALQGVVVVYPHTSNWDFIILVLAKWAIGVPVRFWAKNKLFAVPLFGRWLRWLGGISVDRTSSRGVVTETAAQLAQARATGQYFWLALAPEGTRKYIPGWRSGFYQTALKADVPLGLARLDYGLRELVLLDFVWLSGDEPADIERIARAYDGVRGLRADNAAPIGLLDATVPRHETIVK